MIKNRGMGEKDGLQRNVIVRSLLRGIGQGRMLIVDSMNFVLLFLVYFVVVGLVAILARLVGKNFLDLERRKTGSYFIRRKLRKVRGEQYYRLF